MYRKLYAKVPIEESFDIIFEMAKTQTELETAFKLLHDAYVEQGFISTQANGMHLNVAHALPSTSILIAKLEGKVIGTISIIRDTPLGLPMEKVFDISKLKLNGSRVAEFSCLAIDPKFRRKKGKDVFFPLTLFAAKFAKDYFGVDYLVFNLYPHHADFYNAIFGSEHLIRNKIFPKNYMGAPATGIKLDLNNVESFARKKYFGLGPGRDLYSYTFKKNHSYFKFPDSLKGFINYPVMTPQMLSYFFLEKSHLFSNLSLLENQILQKYYPLKEFQHLFIRKEKSNHIIRKEARWEIDIDGDYIDNFQSKKLKVLFKDVSFNGFRVYVDFELLDHVHSFEVKLGNGEIAKVKAIKVWSSPDKVHGFSILESNETWRFLIETQLEDLSKLVS